MRQFALLVLKIAVSAGLLYLALRDIDFAALQARLRRIDLVWIALSVLAGFVQIGVAALRWREITLACGAELKTGTAMRFQLIGSFFNQTLPSTIGGDGVRLWLLQRNGAPWREATYSVLVDRAVGLIVLAVMVVVSLPWSLALIGNTEGRIALVVLDFAALAACVGFLVLGVLPWGWLKSLWPLRHVQACAVIANRVIFDARSGPRVLGLSILNHLLSVVIAWCVGRAIASPVTFAQMFLLIPPIMLIMTIPISIAGWGVREQTMQVAFMNAGLSGADGLTISLLYGIVLFLIGAAGGLVWLVTRPATQAADARPPSPP
jgi:uncharacterized membrane protein YbhN (UPF0104 family)